MANEQLRQSLFGPSPQEVEMARRAQGRAQDMQWATMPAGRGPVAAAAGAGRMLGDAFSGPDPAQQRARLLQEAQQEVETSGVSLLSSPTDYYKKAIEAMEKRGLHDEAFSVYQILQQSEATSREAGLKEREVGAKEVSAQASMLKAQNALSAGQSPNMLTLSPPGSQRKGAGREQTLDLSDPAQLGEARSLMAKGWIDTSKLPSPPAETNINYPEEDKFAGELGKLRAQATNDLYDTALSTDRMLMNAETINDALDSDQLIVGPGADVRLGIAKALNIGGADNAEIISNTQALIASLANNTLSAIKTSGLGTGQGFTEKDKQFLNEATSGTINFTPDALRRLTELTTKVAKASVKKWNDQLGYLDDTTKARLRRVGIPTDPMPIPKLRKREPKPIPDPKNPNEVVRQDGFRVRRID